MYELLIKIVKFKDKIINLQHMQTVFSSQSNKIDSDAEQINNDSRQISGQKIHKMCQNLSQFRDLTSSSYYYSSRKEKSKEKIVSPELQSIISKIQKFAESIDQKVQNRVQLVKHVYLNQYKQQVIEMANQLKTLREKLDNEVMMERANDKLFYLEQERDFFRSQVVKLNEQMSKINQENKRLKKTIQDEKRQSQNYKKIVYSLENKLMKIKNLNTQKQKLMANQDSQKQRKIKGYQMSTIDSQGHHRLLQRANTERSHKNLPPNRAALDINNNNHFTRTETKMRVSHSMRDYKASHTHRYSQPKKNYFAQTTTVNYPKKISQKLEKIQGYGDLLEKQQIVNACLNEVKKEIYYRKLQDSEENNWKLHFNETQKVTFEQFTKTDKKSLIVKILSNEKILQEFYGFLFSRPSAQALAQRIEEKLNTKTKDFGELKLDNPQQNTKALSNIKTQFDKRIFLIKNGAPFMRSKN